MTRDVIEKLKFPKPACIHSKFLPSIKGFDTKMSTSDESTALFLVDNETIIRDKIKKYAFSGGG